MREIVKPTVVPHPDFIGCGAEQGTALVDKNLVLAGRLEKVEWRSHELQVITCGEPECGHSGCADKGYVVLRRAGNFVVWAPAADLMQGSDDCRYWPPDYFADGLAPLWGLDQWNAMAARLGWPTSSALEPLTWSEAKLIAEFESPRGVLTERLRPDPPDLADLVFATSPEIDMMELLRLCNLSGWDLDLDIAFRVESADNAELLSLFVEYPYAELKVFGRTDGGRWWPWLRPGVLLVPAPNRGCA